MKALMIVVAGLVLIYVISGNNSSQTSSDNYGQYDKGTPLCDEGAYGAVNGLCK
ncbi:hypothetical protein N9Y59_02840 [Planktomarina temperata]|nr:hypothetical protein [Planktomarina temperata]